jgi:SAM-dependent methyltransferase
VTSAFSNRYSAAYDLLNEGKPYHDEVVFIQNIFSQTAGNSRELTSVLDLGCGSGKHLAEFKSTAKKVGVDRSESMLAEAVNRKIPNSSFIANDICAVNVEMRFDLVYSLFHVLSYQITEQDLILFFRSIAQHLEKDGAAVVDFWHRTPWDRDPPITRITRRKSNSAEVIRISEPKCNLLTGVVEIHMDLFVKSEGDEFTHFTEDHTMRSYTLGELSLAAQLAGLEISASGPWMQQNQPLLSSDWYGWVALTHKQSIK